MGKNLTAEECNQCGNLLYYGASCKRCIDIENEIYYQAMHDTYQTERVEGFIPADMEFEDWCELREIEGLEEYFEPVLKCGCKKRDFFESITGEMICRCMLNNTAKKLREDKNENGKNMGNAE